MGIKFTPPSVVLNIALDAGRLIADKLNPERKGMSGFGLKYSNDKSEIGSLFGIAQTEIVDEITASIPAEKLSK